MNDSGLRNLHMWPLERVKNTLEEETFRELVHETWHIKDPWTLHLTAYRILLRKILGPEPPFTSWAADEAKTWTNWLFRVKPQFARSTALTFKELEDTLLRHFHLSPGGLQRGPLTPEICAYAQRHHPPLKTVLDMVYRAAVQITTSKLTTIHMKAAPFFIHSDKKFPPSRAISRPAEAKEGTALAAAFRLQVLHLDLHTFYDAQDMREGAPHGFAAPPMDIVEPPSYAPGVNPIRVSQEDVNRSIHDPPGVQQVQSEYTLWSQQGQHGPNRANTARSQQGQHFTVPTGLTRSQQGQHGPNRANTSRSQQGQHGPNRASTPTTSSRGTPTRH